MIRRRHLAAAAAGALLAAALGLQGVSAQIAPGNTASCSPPSPYATCTAAGDSQEVDRGVANLLTIFDDVYSHDDSQLIHSGNANRLSISGASLGVAQSISSGNGNMVTYSNMLGIVTGSTTQTVSGNGNSLDLDGDNHDQSVTGNGNTLTAGDCNNVTEYGEGSQTVDGNGNTICSLSFTVDSITGNGNRISDTGSEGPSGANFVFVTGNSNTVNVPGYGDTVTVGSPGGPALGDSVTDDADNTKVSVSGDADDLVIPMLYSGDTITCTGNSITSLSSSDCILTP